MLRIIHDRQYNLTVSLRHHGSQAHSHKLARPPHCKDHISQSFEHDPFQGHREIHVQVPHTCHPVPMDSHKLTFSTAGHEPSVNPLQTVVRNSLLLSLLGPTTDEPSCWATISQLAAMPAQSCMHHWRVAIMKRSVDILFWAQTDNLDIVLKVRVVFFQS